MDLLFRGEHCAADSWCCVDCLREVAGLPEQTVFHVWNRVRASKLNRVLSVGLASVFIRGGFNTLLVTV